MARFQFRLANVLRLKKQLLQQAEWQVMIAVQAVLACQQQIQQVQDELVELSANMAAAVGQSDAEPDAASSSNRPREVRARDWQHDFAYAEDLRLRRQQLEQRLDQLREIHRQKEARRRELNVEVESLETLRINGKLQFEHEDALKWQHELDEFLLRDYTPQADPGVLPEP